MATERVRTHVVHRDGKTYTRTSHTRHTNRRRRPPSWKLKPKRALRNAKRAYRAAKRNQGWTFALWGTAATSEILAFTAFRGFGALFSVAGVGLTGLGAWMRGRSS